MKFYFMTGSNGAFERRTGIKAFTLRGFYDHLIYKKLDLSEAYNDILNGKEVKIEDGLFKYASFRTKHPITICKTLWAVIARNDFIEPFTSSNILSKCFILPIKTEPEVDANIIIPPVLEPDLVFDMAETVLEVVTDKWVGYTGEDVISTTKFYRNISLNIEKIREYNIFQIDGAEYSEIIVSQKFVDEFVNTGQYGIEFEEVTSESRVILLWNAVNTKKIRLYVDFMERVLL